VRAEGEGRGARIGAPELLCQRSEVKEAGAGQACLVLSWWLGPGQLVDLSVTVRGLEAWGSKPDLRTSRAPDWLVCSEAGRASSGCQWLAVACTN
jgi:hypothetical protein